MDDELVKDDARAELSLIDLAGQDADDTGMSWQDVEEIDDVEMSWQERALCAQTDPEAFFPEKGGSTREAKKVCVSCEVRAECLEYALENDERFGIWGGLSERERRKLKRRAV
ncbi:WhiB family redox-sensing transcriptional regulator [Brachybacterium sacelli]|uniref:Transcriptional regulator WhiB n=3 Tax=Brachybacterium TaxID=43668 RepID=A0ABS4X5D4_9MICO|nr:WhiB family transcriptional regulator [Brachybacterium sacelli]MBP2383546.1 WhiB family redox-sensing transcriptional regulator [Brachybacterium sacelli]